MSTIVTEASGERENEVALLSSVRAYVRDMRPFVVISHEDMTHLVATMRCARGYERGAEEQEVICEKVDEQIQETIRDAKEQLILSNWRLAFQYARRYASWFSDIPLLDLVQEANLGLLHAVKKYDPSQGKFSTYATRWIRMYLQRAVTEQRSLVIIPPDKRAEIRRVEVAQQKLQQQQDHEPTVEELAQVLGMVSAKVAELLLLLSSSTVISLDAPLKGSYDDGYTLAETLFGEVEGYSADSQPTLESVYLSIEREQLRACFSHVMGNVLRPRERAVIELRYGLSEGRFYTLMEAAHCLHMSHEGVRLIERRALKKLRCCPEIQRWRDALFGS